MSDTDGRGFDVVGDESLHEWAMFSLVRRSLLDPDGSVFERSFVASPGAVGVVAIDDDDTVVLVEQFRAALGGWVVEIPAGMRDVEGEDPVVTARRELLEETGMTASHWTRLGSIHSAPGITDSEVTVFLATGLVDGVREPHGPEETHMTLSRIPLDEALARVDEGAITDAKTVYGLLSAGRLRDARR